MGILSLNINRMRTSILSGVSVCFIVTTENPNIPLFVFYHFTLATVLLWSHPRSVHLRCITCNNEPKEWRDSLDKKKICQCCVTLFFNWHTIQLFSQYFFSYASDPSVAAVTSGSRFLSPRMKWKNDWNFNLPLCKLLTYSFWYSLKSATSLSLALAGRWFFPFSLSNLGK